MEKKLRILIFMFLITTILVAFFGAYLLNLLAPVGLFQEKSPMEVPFLVMKDPAARFALEDLHSIDPEPTVPASTEPEEPIIPERHDDYFNIKPLPPLKTPKTPPAYEITENWFDDVLFIGDSRTVGLRDFARLGDADYFCSVGMTVFDAKTLALSDTDFESRTLEQLLQEKCYGKIYICLGLNECGYPFDLLMEGYGSLIDLVHTNEPSAVIILHGMITVSRIKEASKACFALDNLNRINMGIEAFANGRSIRYIDANEHFADVEGYLPYDSTPDGCHFYISGYQDWAKWIFENAKTLNISFG